MMKLEIEEKDLESIASRVLSRLKPLLKATEIDTIMTIGDLASYITGQAIHINGGGIG